MKWFPDVSSEDGARDALKSGSFGALFAAGLTAIGLAGFLYGMKIATPIYGQGETLEASSSQAENIAVAIGIGLEMVLFLVCAWRFRQGKGRYLGCIALLAIAFEVVNKLMTGMPNVGFLLMFAAVMAGLFNGVRGAWALPRIRASDGEQA